MKEYKVDLPMYDGKVREVVSEAVQKKAFDRVLVRDDEWRHCIPYEGNEHLLGTKEKTR